MFNTEVYLNDAKINFYISEQVRYKIPNHKQAEMTILISAKQRQKPLQ